jgi:hypothetical protein
MHVSGGAGAGELVLHEAAQDDNSSSVDCLEHVSCVKVSTLVVIITCTYVCLLLLGTTLGEIS